MDESVLPATLCDHSLYLETGLAGGQQITACHRERTGSIQRPATLGKIVYNISGETEIYLREIARLHPFEREVRSEWQIPQPVSEHEHLWRVVMGVQIGTPSKTVKKTAWIVARDEVFWPTSNLEQGPVLTNLDLGLGSHMEDTPAFRDRFR